MLKKVLKEYCAPIPEESEEPSPDEKAKATAPENASTNIVMVMNTAADSSMEQMDVLRKQNQELQSANWSEDRTGRPESPRAISPMTRA